MPFSISFPTRHTDTFAATGFVHAGVLLALTELAYAAFEAHCAISKPDHVVAVQRETRAVYHAPLRWQEGAAIDVVTIEATPNGFVQEFAVRAAETGRAIATFVHHWAWLDLNTGRAASLPADVSSRLLAG